MTSMTSCIVGKKIRAMGPGPLSYFPLLFLLLNFVFFLKNSIPVSDFNEIYFTHTPLCTTHVI